MTYRSEMIQIAAVAIAAIQVLDSGDTSGDIDKVFDCIRKERTKQENKWGTQAHTPAKWMIILMEEVGEAAKDILEDNF